MREAILLLPPICLHGLDLYLRYVCTNRWEARHRWEDNIKMDLQEVGGGHGNWMELAQDRDRWRAVVGTVRNFRVP
jgi:hypothetical protein